MDGFGDLFKAFGDLIGGAMDDGAPEVLAAFTGVGGETQTVSQTATHDRVLTGRPRTLNINDR